MALFICKQICTNYFCNWKFIGVLYLLLHVWPTNTKFFFRAIRSNRKKGDLNSSIFISRHSISLTLRAKISFFSIVLGLVSRRRFFRIVRHTSLQLHKIFKPIRLIILCYNNSILTQVVKEKLPCMFTNFSFAIHFGVKTGLKITEQFFLGTVTFPDMYFSVQHEN